jgi:hypothetical protein
MLMFAVYYPRPPASSKGQRRGRYIIPWKGCSKELEEDDAVDIM